MGTDKKDLKLFFILNLFFILFLSCNNNKYSADLMQIDSLLMAKEFEQADSLLRLCDSKDYTTSQDQAFHALLRVQCDYKNYIVATTDSAINLAVDYFKKSQDKEKYTRSLIYQGCVNEELGNLEKAVDCYHKAEEIADKTDLCNISFAKMRLGLLYQGQIIGAKTIALEKLKEALLIYEKMGEKHYELVCLSEVARLYTDISQKEDSVSYYLERSIKLAENLNDSSFIRENLFSKSQYLTEIKHDYLSAIQINKKAISIKGIIDHPRIHYCLAKCYSKVGNIDSALFYVNSSPKMIDVADSILYYDVMYEIEKAKGREILSREYYEKSQTMADSVLLSSLNHRLLAVEKKYDTQKVELENAKLSLGLKSALLTLSAIVIVSLVLMLIVIKYRHRLHDKENEIDLIKADLDTSIIGLQKMQDTIAKYDQELSMTKKTYVDQLTNSKSEVNRLNIEIADARKHIEWNVKEHEHLCHQIAILEEKEKHSEEMKSIIRNQIVIVQDLLSSCYEHGGSEMFLQKFKSIMIVPNSSLYTNKSYWESIQSLTNDFYDNILLKVKEKTGNNLSESDINFIALSCWGFSRIGIMICMGYTHLVSVSNKKRKVAKKLGVCSFDEYIKKYLEKINN